MNLLTVYLNILNLMRPSFCKIEAFDRAKELAIALICAFGRKTIASLAIYLGRDDKIPSADYKFFSCCKWVLDDLFNVILKEALHLISGDTIVIAVDDTKIRKSGKKIPYAGWNIDPLGPKFQTNLIWAIRYLQISLLIPLYSSGENIPPRSIPIRFTPAPYVKKPGKKASEEQWKEYEKAKKACNLSTIFVEEVKKLRSALDEMGFMNKKLLVTVDGSFCNKNCMNFDDPRITIIARCKKNAVLCFKSLDARRFYSKDKFNPESIRQNEEVIWHKIRVFYGGTFREIRCKEVRDVLWEKGTKRTFLRTIVVAPLPYVRNGIRNYRSPAYLLTTNRQLSLAEAVQNYLDRWQIEYNHRDEKSILGVGEAQIHNERSVSKQPGFHVVSYSALLLANLVVYGDKNHPDFADKPAWRALPKRNTTRALVGKMRAEMIENPEKIIELGLTVPMIAAILRKAA